MHAVTVSALLLPFVLVTGCAWFVDADPARSAPGPVAQELVFTATDYDFAGPSSIAAGSTWVRVTNRGADVHHLQLVRLDANRSVGEAFASYGADSVSPPWLHAVGGPNGAPPRETKSALVDLEPGLHIVVCTLRAPDGNTHASHGMRSVLNVTEAPLTYPWVFLESDLDVALDDFLILLDAPIVAGAHNVSVENYGGADHEAMVVKLAKNTSVSAFVDAFDRGATSTQSGNPVGGASFLSTGERNVFRVTFTPGRYAFICFAHVAHGMSFELEVTEPP